MTTAKTAKKEVFIGLPRENCHLVFIGGWGGVGGLTCGGKSTGGDFFKWGDDQICS